MNPRQSSIAEQLCVGVDALPGQRRHVDAHPELIHFVGEDADDDATDEEPTAPAAGPAPVLSLPEFYPEATLTATVRPGNGDG